MQLANQKQFRTFAKYDLSRAEGMIFVTQFYQANKNPDYPNFFTLSAPD